MTHPEPRFIDDPKAIDIFADQHSGCFAANGVLRITFERHVLDHGESPAPVARLVVARVNLPVSAAEAMAKGILQLIENIRAEPAAQSQNASKLN